MEPVTLNEAKTHSRVFNNSEDDYFIGLISAARQKFEVEAGYLLSEAEYTFTTRQSDFLFWNNFNWWRPHEQNHIVLPVRPVFLVESVNELVFDIDYKVYIDSDTGICTIDLLTDVDGDIVVTFKAGFPNPAPGDTSTAPILAKHAVKALVSFWNLNRESYQTGSSVKVVPATFQSIVTNFRIA